MSRGKVRDYIWMDIGSFSHRFQLPEIIILFRQSSYLDFLGLTSSIERDIIQQVGNIS